MRTDFTKPSPPTDDKRWKMIGASMRRHGNNPDALIEALHTVQETFGYLDEDAIRFIAGTLRIPLSKIYGVATFYHFFNLTPQGEHTCVVCMGTACYIKGAPKILEAVEKEYGLKAGETSEDGKFSILTARCIGACGLAPAVVFDGEIAGDVSPDDALKRIGRWTKS
ncbi:bidirectional hydrogenase complex protein HoxE [bacterium]|nr:bidirectional hydrogenase complex protein HoxE [bacterium]